MKITKSARKSTLRLLNHLSNGERCAEKESPPSALLDTFAVRSLQQGGQPKTLQKLLGVANKPRSSALKRPLARFLPPPPRKALLKTCSPEHGEMLRSLLHRLGLLPALIKKRPWERKSLTASVFLVYYRLNGSGIERREE